jgi:hypothetical protein
MKENFISKLQSKFTPTAIIAGLKQTAITLYQAILKAGPLAAVAFIFSYIFHWAAIAAVMFFYAAFKKDWQLKSALGIGFTTGVLLWTLYATYLNIANEGLIASRIGALLTGGIGALSAAQLIEMTAILGGALGALGAATGVLAREFLYDMRLKFDWKW